MKVSVKKTDLARVITAARAMPGFRKCGILDINAGETGITVVAQLAYSATYTPAKIAMPLPGIVIEPGQVSPDPETLRKANSACKGLVSIDGATGGSVVTLRDAWDRTVAALDANQVQGGNWANPVPVLDEFETLTFSGSELREALTDCIPSMATESEHRPAFQGVYIGNMGTGVDFVATDGHQLAIHSRAVCHGWIDAGRVIPDWMCKAIAKTLRDDDECAVVAAKSDYPYAHEWVKVTTDSGLEWVAQSPDHFPDYTRVIPQADCSAGVDLDEIGMRIAAIQPRRARNWLQMAEGTAQITDRDQEVLASFPLHECILDVCLDASRVLSFSKVFNGSGADVQMHWEYDQIRDKRAGGYPSPVMFTAEDRPHFRGVLMSCRM